MTDPEHDEAFETYLKRRSVFPEALDEELEPPGALDQRVLDKARQAIRAQAAPDHGKQQMARAPRWAMPVALAATILLCLSVVLNISLNTNRPAPNPQRMSAARGAAEKKVAGLTAPQPPMVAERTPEMPPPANAPAVAAAPVASAPPQAAAAAPSVPPPQAAAAASSAPPAQAAAAAPSVPPPQAVAAASSAPPAQAAAAAPSAPPAQAAAAVPSAPAQAIARVPGAAGSSAAYGESTAQADTGTDVPRIASRSAADNAATLEKRADASASGTTPVAPAGDRQTDAGENSGYVTRQAVRAAAAGPHPTDPKAWLQQIDALRAAGKIDRANTEMHRFRAAFPGYVAKPAPPASSEPPK